MLLPGRLLLPPGSRVPTARQQPPPLSCSAAAPARSSAQRRLPGLLRAKRQETGSEDPEPAPASRKGRKKKTDTAAAEEAAAAAAAAAAAGEEAALTTWLDQGGSPEEDRRRFPYHRRLQTAASDGNIDGAESAFSGMEAAGMAPGPRAFHVLLCAYLKGGDTPGALGVAGRATEAGVQLLSESYAVLIFAAMGSSPPDVDVAKTLYGAVSGTDTDPQLPWSTLCRLLAAKGFAADAVAAVKEGLRAGREMDADVAEAYLKGLCDTEQLDPALSFLESMAARYGIKPEARHVTHVVAGLAKATNFDDASSLIDAAGNRGWGRNAGTFNALLAGIIDQLENDDKEGTLAFSFNKMTGRMVQSGVRPNKYTFKLEAEGHVKLNDPRSAMGSIKSLRTSAGTGGLRLLSPGSLSSLLQLLSERDMPVDMLQLLVSMAEDGCRMPSGALVPDGKGTTPLDAWLSSHLEGMAARADQRSSEAAMLNTPLEYVNGVPLGPGQCVVDEGGFILPVSKCSVKELRAEAEARGILGAKDMKRPELLTAIKAARARLPFNVLQAQVRTAGEGVRGGSKKKASAGAGGKKARKGKGPVREVWVLHGDGGLDIRQAPPDSAFRTEAEKFLLSESALDDIDLTDDQYALASNKNNKEIDFDALLEARMLDEGTAAVMNVGDEDVMSGFATLLPGAEGADEDAAADEDDESKAELDEDAWRKMQSFEERSIDPQTLQEGYRQLQFLEAQQIDTDEANLVAGMDIAMDIVRAAETVGGAVTPSDLLLLTSGALAERNVNAAADIAPRLSLLLAADAPLLDSTAGGAGSGTSSSSTGAVPQGERYDVEFVLQQYEALAEMCIVQRAVQQADVVLEAAEAAGLQPSQAVLARLTAALRGQPRRSERLGRENAALLERAGVDDLGDLSMDNLGLPPTLQQQQQQLSDGTVEPTTTAAAAAAAVARSAAAAAADAPATTVSEGEITVEALSVRDISVQQQEQREEGGAGAGDEELPAELQDVAEVLRGAVAWREEQERIAGILDKLGFDNDALNDVLAQPAALMADLSWLPAHILAATADDGEAAEEDGAEGRQQQGPKSIGDMSLAELAKACADDTLTPEQSEALVEQFEVLGLPLLYDEVDRRILWPGSEGYEAWAKESPLEAAEDEQFIAAAMREVFAEELQAAEQDAADWAEGMKGVDPGAADAADAAEASPGMRDFLSLRQQYQEALQEMGLLPDEQQDAEEAAAAAAGDEAVAREQLLQQLQEQVQQLIDERQDELRAAYQQLGMPLPDLSLTSSGGEDTGSSRQRKQLTGR